MKMSAFWDIAPCSHVEVNRRFRDYMALYPKRLSSTANILIFFFFVLSFHLLCFFLSFFLEPSIKLYYSYTVSIICRNVSSRVIQESTPLNRIRKKKHEIFEQTCSITCLFSFLFPRWTVSIYWGQLQAVLTITLCSWNKRFSDKGRVSFNLHTNV
jgi:hypothetical protein